MYNMGVRKRFAIAALVAIFALGCTRPAARVATHLNNREFYYNRYVEECVAVKGPVSCDEYQKAVNRYRELIIEADAANQRGGKYPLQLKELDNQLKKVKSARAR